MPHCHNHTSFDKNPSHRLICFRSLNRSFLAYGDKEDGVVGAGEEGFGVCGVWAVYGAFLDDAEPVCGDEGPELVPGELEGELAGGVREVPEEGPAVDPDAAGADDAREEREVREDVVRGVDEERRDERVPRGGVLGRGVDVEEVAGGHRHVERAAGRGRRDVAREHVRHAHGAQLVGGGAHVRVLAHERVQSVRLARGRAVEHKVGDEEHEHAELVPLRREAARGGLEHEAPEARAGVQHAHAAPRARVGPALLERREHGAVARRPLARARRAPVARDLHERRAHAVRVLAAERQRAVLRAQLRGRAPQGRPTACCRVWVAAAARGGEGRRARQQGPVVRNNGAQEGLVRRHGGAQGRQAREKARVRAQQRRVRRGQRSSPAHGVVLQRVQPPLRQKTVGSKRNHHGRIVLSLRLFFTQILGFFWCFSFFFSLVSSLLFWHRVLRTPFLQSVNLLHCFHKKEF